MSLTLRIPLSESETLSLVLSLARSVPRFRTETEGGTPASLAIVPDFSPSFDLVERLIGPAAGFSDVQVLIDGRPVEGLTKFLNVLRMSGSNVRVPLPVVAREQGVSPISVRLQEIARQAEVGWRPNLKMLQG